MAPALAGLCLCLATSLPAQIVIDTDGSTAAIDAASSYPMGTPFTVDVYLISPPPGPLPVDAGGIALEFNDVAGVLTLAGPPLFDPAGLGLFAGSTAPVDLVTGTPLVPGAALASFLFAPGAVGPGGPFTMSDGGGGVWDTGGDFFGGGATLPPPGTPILLETASFIAAGVGTTDIAPIGLFPCPVGCAPLPGPPPPPAAAVPPAGVWPGVAELYSFATLGGLPIMTGVTPGTVTVTGPLPVELTAFDALVLAEGVQLSWETATETENVGFEVEHHAVGTGLDEGQQWPTLGFVEGQGTTVEPQHYTYMVRGLLPGRHQFRLKQLDTDGSVQYSALVEAVIEVPGTHLLGKAYPNPFNPQATFTLTVAQTQPVQVTLHDMTGRVIQTLYQGELPAQSAQQIQIDGTDLPSGLYIYRALGATFQESRQVLLLK